MLERNPAPRKILGEPAPGSEIEFLRFLELREISIEPRAFCQQTKDPALIEHVHMVLPHHIIDWREFLAVANESRSEAGEPVFHQFTRSADCGSWSPS